MLRVGIVGLGSMGRNHARVLGELDGVLLAATFDPVGVGVAGVKHLRDLPGFLKHDLDYVVVSSPTSTHTEIALAVANSGRHCLIEKPLAPTVEECKRISSAFTQNGRKVAVGQIERFNPAILEARSKIQSGVIGRVLEYNTIRRGPFPGRVSDVGVALDLATHDIDIVMFLQNSPYKFLTSVNQFVSGRTHEDSVSAVGVLEDGSTVTHSVNWITPHKERRVTVIGTNGSLVADMLTGDLTLFKNASEKIGWQDVAHFRGVAEGDVIRFAFAKQEPLRTEHEAFRDWVLGEETTSVSAASATNVVRVAAALIESGLKGKTVEFLAQQ